MSGRRGSLRGASRLWISLWITLGITLPVGAQTFDNFGTEPLEEFEFDAPVDPQGEFTIPSFNDDIQLVPDDGTAPLGDGIILDLSGDGEDNGALLDQFPGGTGPVTSVSQPPTGGASRLTLRALDRMVGRPVDLELGVGQTVLYGRIAIRVLECRFPVSDPSSDAFAHVQVFDTTGQSLFDGWMVASSPALNALEHPRYDVWVLRCATTS